MHSIELVRILIERGAHLNNALLPAVHDHDMVKFLLGQGAKVVAQSGDPALKSAASTGNIEIIRTLLAHADDAELNGSRDALIYAASAGQVDTINFLTEQGFSVNAFTKTDSLGETPLLAVFYTMEQYLEVVITLLDKGADVSVRSSKGSTPRKS